VIKKSLGFILFCASGFCTGYLAGVPFFKSSLGVSETPAQGDAKPIEEHHGEFVSLASRTREPHEAPKTIKTTKQLSSLSSSPARGIEKLTLPEVQARLQEMNGMLANAATDELEQNLVARWSKLDPIGAAEFAADAVAQGGNPRLLQTAANAWAKTDPVGAAQWAATLDSPLARDTALGQIFGTWSSTNPAQAASAIATLPMGSAQTVATSAVARNFAKGNLDAALKWAEGLSGAVQLAASREIVNLWSTSDPEATGAWIMQQGSQPLRSEALRQLAGNWVSRDPGAAIDYAQTIADVGLRNGFVQSAMQRFSSMDPVAAANWLSSDAAKPHASSLVGSVSSRWAAFDPGSAAGWASSITDSALRNKALSAVSTSWSQANPDQAAQWVGSIKDAQSRDVATAAFSVELAKANPATAAQWASRISDPARLSSSLNRIVSDWKKIDPNAALIRSFLDSHAGGFKAKAAAMNGAWLDPARLKSTSKRLPLFSVWRAFSQRVLSFREVRIRK
jgi:hypothetical protein